MLERIQQACTDAILEWGAAINTAEAATAGPEKESATAIARSIGVRTAELSAALAKKLGK